MNIYLGHEFEDSSVSDSKERSLTKNVSEQKLAAIQRYLDKAEKETKYSINTYSPGSRNKKYYRLTYRRGRKIKHVHLPGGNIKAKLANYRKDKLQEMIDRGAKLDEVLAAIADYRSKI